MLNIGRRKSKEEVWGRSSSRRRRKSEEKEAANCNRHEYFQFYIPGSNVAEGYFYRGGGKQHGRGGRWQDEERGGEGPGEEEQYYMDRRARHRGRFYSQGEDESEFIVRLILQSSPKVPDCQT